MFLDSSGEVRTAAVWGDGIPILLPFVDLVLVPRQQLAPLHSSNPKGDVVAFTWRELEPIMMGYRKGSQYLACYELFYEVTPPAIERVIREKAPLTDKPKAVAFDQILDKELIAP